MLAALNTADTFKKLELLAGLNRVGELVFESGGLPILLDLLEEGNLDRQMIASVIRTAGSEGEAVLLKLLRYHKNEKVRIAVASVLGYRLPASPVSVDVVLDSSDIINLTAVPPGNLCTYVGRITPLAVEYDEEEEEGGEEMTTIEGHLGKRGGLLINTRDFLASLNRLVALNNEHF